MYSENSPFGRMVSVLCLKKTRGFALVLVSLLLTATLYSVYNRGKLAYYSYSHIYTGGDVSHTVCILFALDALY